VIVLVPFKQSIAGPLLRALGLLVAAQTVAHAQSPAAPDAGSLLRDAQRALPSAEPRLPPVSAPRGPRPADDTRFTVQRFDLQGITLIAPVDVQTVLKPWLNREIVFADLEQATQAIATLYQERGWYVRAQVPEQDVVDGVVRIQIIEAQLGAIRFAQTQSWPISRERIERSFQARQSPGQPLNLLAMNRSVSVLNDLPGVSVKAALDSSDKPSATDLLITVEPKPWYSGSASTDNQGSRSTGELRASLNLSLDNPAGLGDQVTANLMGSQGVKYLRMGYSLPVGYDGLRLAVHGSVLNYELVGSLRTPGGTFGSAWTRGLVLSYPWVRKAAGNVNLSLSLNDADYVNYANGLESSRKTGRTAAFYVGGDLYDDMVGGGTNLWGLTYTTGRVAGKFDKLAGNLARLQRLNPSTSLWFSLNAQRALDNLDSSEKFSLGGAQGVRAYPGAQGSGDHGWLLTVEARHTLRPDLQVTLFHDVGGVSYSHDPSTVPPDNAQRLNTYRLQGWGVAMNYSITSKTSARLTVSRRLGNNPVASPTTGFDADGTRVSNRVWFNLSSFF
jgi:hemolysin activation/secretion protein